MELIVCAVFDKAANCYQRPFFVQTRGVAIRAFTDEVNRATQDNLLYQHPGDFELHYIGMFDDSSGEIASVKPDRVVLGDDVKSQ